MCGENKSYGTHENGIIEKYDEQFQKGLFIATGSFTGNTFNGDWNITDLDPLFYNGTVKVTLNNDHDMVTEVIWTENYTSSVNGSPSFKSTSSFTGNNLNLFSTFTPGDFQVSGIQTKNHLSSVTYSAQSLVTSANISLEDHSCNEYSYIQVQFMKE